MRFKLFVFGKNQSVEYSSRHVELQKVGIKLSSTGNATRLRLDCHRYVKFGTAHSSFLLNMRSLPNRFFTVIKFRTRAAVKTDSPQNFGSCPVTSHGLQ